MAGRSVALGELVEEAGIEIDALVGRAIEGAHRRLRRAAATIAGLIVDMKHRRLVRLPRGCEQPAPLVLGRGENLACEMRLGVRRANLGRALRFRRLLVRPDQRTSPASERIEARSEEHTSELQSLMRTSYDVLCLKKKHGTD